MSLETTTSAHRRFASAAGDGEGTVNDLFSSQSTRSLTSPDGAKIVYSDLGDSCCKEILLLLPGALGFAESDFTPQCLDLKADFRVLAVDPRGYGRSRPPQRDFPTSLLRRDARDAAAVTEHALGVGGGRVTVCGWSDGANSAVMFAAERPDLTKRLVMWGGNACITKVDMDCYEASKDTSKWSPRMVAPLLKEYGPEQLQSMWTAWLTAMEAIHRSTPDGDICKSDAMSVSVSMAYPAFITCPIWRYYPCSVGDFTSSPFPPLP